jgi:hypothetical protein
LGILSKAVPLPVPRCVALLLAFVLCCVQSPSLVSAADDILLPDLKVAFIYNFTRFIHWPKAPAGQPFVIGVVSDPAMENHLRILEQEARLVDGRPIAIHAYTGASVSDCCEILFIGGSASAELEAIVRHTAGKPVLLVGDTPGYAGRGVAIELFRKPDIFRKTERLRLRINPSALRNRDLQVSAQLYDVAEVLE